MEVGQEPPAASGGYRIGYSHYMRYLVLRTKMPNDDEVAPVDAGDLPAVSSVEVVSLKTFFEKIPPGRYVRVQGNDVRQSNKMWNGKPVYMLQLPDLQLFCTSALCKGVRIFSSDDDIEQTGTENKFVRYLCQNCKDQSKSFAISCCVEKGSALIEKYGEIPPFGPPTPARLATLVGRERDLFFKGRRCESQSLGIAAFAYYRRVVENRKDWIVDEIMRVSKGLGAEPELLADLEQAKRETRFSVAVEAVKHAIPQALLVNGHNPLSLLHAALSEGLHARSDEECLELAASIRIILTEFVERAASAMNDQAELSSAVSRLLAVKRT